MNLLLFEPEEMMSDNTLVLNDRRSEHIIRVLGCEIGDIIRAGMVNGPVGSGEIVSITRGQENPEVLLRFTAESEAPDQPQIDLIMGLVRPIMLKKILAQAASLGVGSIFLINANRVEKSFFGARLLKEGNYRPYLLEGLEQAKDTFLPKLTIHNRFRPFVEDYIPTIAKTYTTMLVAHPEAPKRLKQLKAMGMKGRTLVAVGPEGGWVDFEIEEFLAQSFEPISLGNRILRTDTAVVSLLAQLMMLRE